MTALLTGTASLAAAVALLFLRHYRPAVFVFVWLSATLFLWTLFDPSVWTPEGFLVSESSLAVAAAFVGIGASRRAGARPDVMFSALCLVLTAGVAGQIACDHVPMVRNFAYRGLAFADLAVVALLATVAQRSVVVDRLDGVALRWLTLAFAFSSLRLLLFEFHFGLGRFFGWLQVGAWIGAMLLIAREAIGQNRRHRETWP